MFTRMAPAAMVPTAMAALDSDSPLPRRFLESRFPFPPPQAARPTWPTQAQPSFSHFSCSPSAARAEAPVNVKPDTAPLRKGVLCLASEMADGELREFVLDPSRPDVSTAVLYRLGGEFFLTGSKCTHLGVRLVAGVPMRVQGSAQVRRLSRSERDRELEPTISCPAHDASFSVRSGAVLRGPAGLEPIPVFSDLLSVDRKSGEVRCDFAKVVARFHKDDAQKTAIAEANDVAVARKRYSSYARRDPHNTETFVIVGAGAAGVSAAEEMRASGFTGRIVLLSKEGVLPYDRVMYSKRMSAKPEELRLRSAAFYEALDLELRLLSEVVSVDVAKQTVTYVDLSGEGGRQVLDQANRQSRVAAATAQKRVVADPELNNVHADAALLLQSAGGARAGGLTVADRLPQKTVAFDKLLLATGCTPRRQAVMGSDLNYVFQLRSHRDAEKIVSALSNNRRVPNKVVVVGSSFIGMETAAALSRMGCEVTIVGRAAVPFERILGRRVGAAYAKHIIDNGIKWVPGATVCRITGDRRVTGVELEDGELLPADAVVFGVGVKPELAHLFRALGADEETRKLREAQITSGDAKDPKKRVAGVGKAESASLSEVPRVPFAADGSVLVTPTLSVRTFSRSADASVPKSSDSSDSDLKNVVFAAGDIATYPSLLGGKLADVRIEHWDTAAQQGRVAGHNMAATSESLRAAELSGKVKTKPSVKPYDEVPFFWSMVFGKPMKFVGFIDPNRGFDEVIVEGDLFSMDFTAYYSDETGAVTAVCTVGRGNTATVCGELMRLGAMPPLKLIKAGAVNSTDLETALQAHNRKK